MIADRMRLFGILNKCIKITVDSSKIDSNLTHFPLSVVFSSSNCGSLFDEIGDSYQKIRVSKDLYGQNQLYVEVEYWNASEKKAVLHVSKSDWVISSSSDTYIYLHYSSVFPNNTTYVGAMASAVGENVWDSNFVFVSHVEDLKDSTGNASDGSNYSTSEEAALLGQGLETNNGYATFPHHNSHNVADKCTLAIAFKTSNNCSYSGLICKDIATTSSYKYMIYVSSSSENVSLYIRTSSGVSAAKYNGSVKDSAWHYFVGVYDKSLASKRLKLYIDGNLEAEADGYNEDILSSTNTLALGRWGASYRFDAFLDEARISDTARSAAWIKAEYYSVLDSLLSFESIVE